MDIGRRTEMKNRAITQNDYPEFFEYYVSLIEEMDDEFGAWMNADDPDFFYKSSTYCKIYSNWKEIQSKMVNTMHHSIKKLVEEELSNFKPPNRNLTNRGSLELK